MVAIEILTLYRHLLGFSTMKALKCSKIPAETLKSLLITRPVPDVSSENTKTRSGFRSPITAFKNALDTAEAVYEDP